MALFLDDRSFCRKHPSYRGTGKPRVECEKCWSIYRANHGMENLLLQLLKGKRLSFKEILRELHCSPDEFNEAVFNLRKRGIDVQFAKHDKTFFISDIPTPYHKIYPMKVEMEGVLGLISDTHLCSTADRLDLCEKAYDDFKKAGVQVVLHTGDISDGWKVYRGQVQYVKTAGDMRQAIYVIQNYPKRDGITTYFISGNHDLDSFHETGTDRCSLIVNGFDFEKKHYDGRKDLVYLGQFSAVLIFPQEVRVVLLHPRGGNTYAYSYNQQKRSQSYSPDTRPDLEISGHFHFYNHCFDLGSHLIAMPGLQDETEFFVRLGLKRQLGYVLLYYKIEKGRFSYLRPEVRMFW